MTFFTRLRLRPKDRPEMVLRRLKTKTNQDNNTGSTPGGRGPWSGCCGLARVELAPVRVVETAGWVVAASAGGRRPAAVRSQRGAWLRSLLHRRLLLPAARRHGGVLSHLASIVLPSCIGLCGWKFE